jgi:uroporphyrinogen III methyltransferase/synthase
MTAKTGKVYLVGAGPGDPGLLTVRGAECLGAADVVLYDYLAEPQLLAHAPPGAEFVCLGRHGQGRMMTQVEINQFMVRHARQGRTVVRLKGGDPMIFGRVADELAALAEAGVPHEIVPGITAAQAAGSHAGICLTHRDQASCVTLVTGQESSDKGADEQLDYKALAQVPGTLVFYMGVTTAPRWSRALVEHGKPPQTPVAIVRRASLPDQETVFTTLAEVGEVIARHRLRPPAVIIVGDVAGEAGAVSWFTSRPLFGRTVLVTRPAGSVPIFGSEKMGTDPLSHKMPQRLRRLGAAVVCQPAIEITEPRDWGPVDAAIARLDAFDWLVFSSSNGVRYFLTRLMALGHDLRVLGGRRLAAIGPGTAEVLAECHLSVDVQPEMYRAEALAEALAPHAKGQRFLLARASRGREVLPATLAAAGGIVEQVVVYESRDVQRPDETVARATAAGQIDWTTVTSSAIARSLVKMFGDALRKTRLAAISPISAGVLRELGHEPAVVADRYTIDGVVDAILTAEGDLQTGRGNA